MTDFTEIVGRVCETNFDWQMFVEGSKGDIYSVSYGPAGPGSKYARDYACSCPAFTHHPEKYCKHILAHKDERCGWGAEGFCGSFDIANEDGTCPSCGGETRFIKVAV